MTAIDHAALREKLAAINPGPWRTIGQRPHGIAIGRAELPNAAGDCHLPPAELNLIVAAVNALPALLDELDAAEKRVEELAGALAQMAAIGAKFNEPLYAALRDARIEGAREMRERCARIAETQYRRDPDGAFHANDHPSHVRQETERKIALAIRALSPETIAEEVRT